MIGFRGELRVLVATRPIDFRRGVHGLVAMVARALIGDPYCGDIFALAGEDHLDQPMVLVTKWLEEGGFTFPPVQDGAVSLTATQLSLFRRRDHRRSDDRPFASARQLRHLPRHGLHLQG